MQTQNLALPLLAAAQAQKHVTHNEALALLDALVHLAVAGVADVPPQDPTPGLRLLVGDAPSGPFAGHAGAIAFFDEGAWRILAPRAGWSVLVEAPGVLLVHDGTAFRPISHFAPAIEELPRLGIGTAPDDLNRLAVKVNAALFTARQLGEGGTGDLRFVLNKESAGATVSQLYQSAWGGRAETGLVGDENFHVRVSGDGAIWHDAIVCERESGGVRFPSGILGLHAGARNLLINPGFAIDQRGFGGGALAAGAYGFDRWKAGAGGASLARAWDGTITLEGSVEQVVESADLAGEIVTLSLDAPSAPLAIALGAGADLASATIPAGTGRRRASLQVPWSVHGHLTVRITASAPTTFRRVQLETGPVASAYERRPRALEEALCQRYCHVIGPGLPNGPIGVTAGRQSTLHNALVRFPVPMRAPPTCTASVPGSFSIEIDAGTDVFEHVLTAMTFVTASREIAHFSVSPGYHIARGRPGILRAFNASARLAFEAEL
ncbi:DUF2793 domain-containing protein [Salinarimonas sp.]|uniref:DUF2793 domain-containing protein n=1 Tax=Salinarimonas sp. TaxID=2766526 RepID=UPI00391AB284